MPNRLARETSPYLLQHKDNPVDWYPWGEEALARAKAENKPILLSIGYSACHWCHVMERESFENPVVAAMMNEHFVCIKVDREERPDLDRIYQNVAQALTRSGGWPLTVFLTPELKPFFGGTYFPPDDRYGRAGFRRVLEALSTAYQGDTEGVTENARRLTEFIQAVEGVASPGRERPGREALARAAEGILAHVDWSFGGLGWAPKFPNAPIFTFLWRSGKRDAVELLLERMACGGIYDQLGGGFHRYSVDETWSVPHFEKMLYDNALLLKLYAEVLVSRGESLASERRELFMRVVGETVDYALREVRDPEGGFYSAQDADTAEGEGSFFVWTPLELRERLEPEEYEAFSRAYGVTETGNFERGATVLHLTERGPRPGDPKLESARAKLLQTRSARPAPETDRKLLAGWNGLMLSGLSWAALALREAGRDEDARRALVAARETLGLLQTRFSREGNRLWASLQEGQPKLNAYLDDYAFCAMGALDFARVTDDAAEIARGVESAAGWLEVLLSRFKDPDGPGYFFTSDDHEALIHRSKSIHDQAIPSGMAVALECLCALGELDPKGQGGRYREELRAQLDALFPLALQAPQACGELLSAALLDVQGPLVVEGPGASAACVHARVFQRAPEAGAGANRLRVCHEQSCSLPFDDVAQLREEVRRRLGGR